MYQMGEAEIDAVRKVIQSEKLFRYQPGNHSECDLFEKEFAEKMGSTYSILLSSGTNALIAALRGLEIGAGDEVLIPSYTFVATAAAVVLAGAKPVIVNIDESLGISVHEARRKVTSKTKAIIPVHMDGLAANMEAVCELAKDSHLIVIEDCAQAMGGSFSGRRLGTWGQAGAFSLNENKNISCGEGGVVITTERGAYERMFSLQDLSAQFNPVKKTLFQSPPQALGMSMRVSEIQGAIARVQLTRLDDILKALRIRKQIFRETLSDLPHLKLLLGACVQGDCASSLHLCFDNPIDAAATSRQLLGSRIMAVFPTLRPAHVAWKWLDLIDPEAAQSVKKELAPSMNILMRVLKYDIDPRLSLEETTRIAREMHDLLEASG